MVDGCWLLIHGVGVGVVGVGVVAVGVVAVGVVAVVAAVVVVVVADVVVVVVVAIAVVAESYLYTVTRRRSNTYIPGTYHSQPTMNPNSM